MILSFTGELLCLFVYCRKWYNKVLNNALKPPGCKLMEFEVRTGRGSYPVYVERGALKKAADIIGKDRKVFIVTDSGVPEKWVDMLKAQFKDAGLFAFPQGEASKNIQTWSAILSAMLGAGVTRSDTLVALGGGVAGDIGGFAAASYMRGIRFVNVPTTVLSQIDSGIGGKTAVDFGGVKNSVGAFWQPAAVIADPDVLSTLPRRQFSSGLAEAVKAGIIRDPQLFAIFEKDDFADHIEEIICRSLLVKKAIVEEDELEAGSRKLLNFGHTLGHSYESILGPDACLHGECVAMGMMAMLDSPELKARLAKVLERLGLPAKCDADPEKVLELVRKDKKAGRGRITAVLADEIGKAYLKDIEIEELRGRLAR